METIRTDDQEVKVFDTEVQMRTEVTQWSRAASRLFKVDAVIEICWIVSSDRILYTNAQNVDHERLVNGHLTFGDMKETRSRESLQGNPRMPTGADVSAVLYPAVEDGGVRGVLFKSFGADMGYGFGCNLKLENWESMSKRVAQFNEMELQRENDDQISFSNGLYKREIVEVMEMITSIFHGLPRTEEGLMNEEISDNILRLESMIVRLTR